MKWETETVSVGRRHVVRRLHFVLSENSTSQTGTRDSWVCNCGNSKPKGKPDISSVYILGKDLGKKALKILRQIEIYMGKKEIL